jgi:hypothetical protein
MIRLGLSLIRLGQVKVVIMLGWVGLSLGLFIINFGYTKLVLLRSGLGLGVLRLKIRTKKIILYVSLFCLS